MFVEVGGGIYAGSLAIISDSVHLLFDVSGFAVSIFAAHYAAKKSTGHHSFGYHRLEVLGALASMLSVWLLTGVLIWEAFQRILKPEPVDGKIMFILAIVGIFVNVGLFSILGGHGHSHDHGSSIPMLDSSDSLNLEAGESEHDHVHDGDNHTGHSHDHDHEDNINMRSAIMHVLGDLVQSIGVAIAGALIWWHQDDPRWALADPICTFFFAVLVMYTTLAVMRDVSDVLMERAPRGMDVDKISEDICLVCWETLNTPPFMYTEKKMHSLIFLG